MRNLLIHQYGEVDVNIVWDTLSGDLVPLIDAIERYVEDR